MSVPSVETITGSERRPSHAISHAPRNRFFNDPDTNGTSSRQQASPARNGQSSRLRAMREAAGKTQVEVGAAPGSDQAEMSKLERRPDMMLSTLRRYAEALGARCEARTVRVTNTGA